jgi:hypothetical protein
MGNPIKSPSAPAKNTNPPTEQVRITPGQTIRHSKKSGEPLPTPAEGSVVGHDVPLSWKPVDNGPHKPFKF